MYDKMPLGLWAGRFLEQLSGLPEVAVLLPSVEVLRRAGMNAVYHLTHPGISPLQRYSNSNLQTVP